MLYLVSNIVNPFLLMWLALEARHWTSVPIIAKIMRYPQRLVCWSPKQKHIDIGVALFEALNMLGKGHAMSS